MASGRSGIPRHLQALFSLGTAAALSDGELLERFASRRDAAAEAAFAALVERHGPLVLRVCRDLLRDPDDAEDAFQATFLVLVRRAGSIRKRDSLASWLYGVALRVAACTRSSTSRRRVHERKAAALATELVGVAEGHGDDLGTVIHEEVSRLPEAHRAALMLCYWEGLTHEQAAERLGWPLGTVRSRLAWARRRLRARLSRRGLAPTAAFLLPPTAATPSALIDGTVRAALQLTDGRAPGIVPASAWALAEGVSRTMMLAKCWKMTTLALLTLGVAAAGAGGLAQQERSPDAPGRPATTQNDSPVAVPPAREPDFDREIRLLEEYQHILSEKIKERQKIWRELAAKPDLEFVEPTPATAGASTLPHIMPNKVSVDEYKKARAELFQVTMDLIQAQALLRTRQADAAAIRGRPGKAGPQEKADDVEGAFLSAPEMAATVDRIAEVASKLIALRKQARDQGRDREEIILSRDLQSLSSRYQRLWALKESMPRRGPGPNTRDDVDPQLAREIEAMKVRRATYEEILSKLEVASAQGSDAAKLAFLREDLAGLRSMQESVMKRIEQLRYNARRR